MPPKIANKLTDAEKKKIKQLNKAKANPEKSKLKEVKNLERQYSRGQLKRPEELLAEEELKAKKLGGNVVPTDDTLTKEQSKIVQDKALLKAERSRILALKLASFRKDDVKPVAVVEEPVAVVDEPVE